MAQDTQASGGVGSGDDLTRIAGIGFTIAHRLSAAGIATYDDLASRSASEIAEILPGMSGLSPARIDGWRGQARRLAAAMAPREQTVAAAGDSPQAEDHQHYESFLVRVLLDDDDSIRSTLVERVGTDQVLRWAGWAPEPLLDFIATATSPGMTTHPGEEPQPPAEHLAPVAADHALASAPLQAPTAEPKRRMRRTPSAGLSIERNVLRAAEPFSMTMSLDLSGAAMNADRIAYSAILAAKPLGGGPKRTVARAEGLLATETPTVIIDAQGLPAGVYRLEGAISLREPGTGHREALAAMAEGLLLQVLAD